MSMRTRFVFRIGSVATPNLPVLRLYISIDASVIFLLCALQAALAFACSPDINTDNYKHFLGISASGCGLGVDSARDRVPSSS